MPRQRAQHRPAQHERRRKQRNHHEQSNPGRNRGDRSPKYRPASSLTNRRHAFKTVPEGLWYKLPAIGFPRTSP
jgi:hypothetical protein